MLDSIDFGPVKMIRSNVGGGPETQCSKVEALDSNISYLKAAFWKFECQRSSVQNAPCDHFAYHKHLA